MNTLPSIDSGLRTLYDNTGEIDPINSSEAVDDFLRNEDYIELGTAGLTAYDAD